MNNFQDINLGGEIFSQISKFRKIWTVHSKHLSCWISGICFRDFKGTHTVQSPCKYYFISPSNKTSRKNIVSKKQCTSSSQRSNNWVLLSASKSTQWYRVRERKWQTRETLAMGEYHPYTSLHTNGKEKNVTTSNIKI